MILVDSNILVYAINVSSPKHKKAQEFLQKNINSLLIAHQNIFETLRVLTHPKFTHPMKTSDAIEAVWRIAEVCQIICPDYKTHRLAIEVINKYKLKADKIFDAYLIATLFSNGFDIIATDNIRDFQIFSGLQIVNPFSDLDKN